MSPDTALTIAAAQVRDRVLADVDDPDERAVVLAAYGATEPPC